MCRKQKLIQEFWTSANEKAAVQITSLKGGYVPKADPRIMKVRDDLRPIGFAPKKWTIMKVRPSGFQTPLG